MGTPDPLVWFLLLETMHLLCEQRRFAWIDAFCGGDALRDQLPARRIFVARSLVAILDRKPLQEREHQVLHLLNELREQLGFAMVFVSHDLALVASLAHRITVMYAGHVVDSAHASALLQHPRPDSTRRLRTPVLRFHPPRASERHATTRCVHPPLPRLNLATVGYVRRLAAAR